MLINFLTMALISLSFSPIFSSLSINDLLSFAIVPTLLITSLMNTLIIIIIIIIVIVIILIIIINKLPKLSLLPGYQEIQIVTGSLRNFVCQYWTEAMPSVRGFPDMHKTISKLLLSRHFNHV